MLRTVMATSGAAASWAPAASFAAGHWPGPATHSTECRSFGMSCDWAPRRWISASRLGEARAQLAAWACLVAFSGGCAPPRDGGFDQLAPLPELRRLIGRGCSVQ